jgi:hypothetical protein
MVIILYSLYYGTCRALQYEADIILISLNITYSPHYLAEQLLTWRFNRNHSLYIYIYNSPKLFFSHVSNLTKMYCKKLSTILSTYIFSVQIY